MYKFNPDDIILAIDTETTDFIKKGRRQQDGQGRVCQVALLLFDGRGKSIMEVSTLVKPDGWTIGEGAGKIHGFTDEQCERFGVGQKSMIGLYRCMAAKADVIIAHNSDFDQGMIEIEEDYSDECPNLSQKPWFCTMKTNTHITGGKWPKLEEALKHFCDRELGEFAHDAMYDVKACRDIFLAMHGVAA